MKRILSAIILFLCIATVGAQGESSSNAAAVKYFKKAQKALQSKDLQLSLSYAEMAVKKDPHYVEAYLLAAEDALFMGMCEKSCYYYTQAINADTKHYYKHYYFAAYQYMKCGKPDTAVMYFEEYFRRHPNPSGIAAAVRNDNELCKWRIEQMSHPLDISLHNMGANINSEWEEYLPAITADESMLIYTVQRPRDKQTRCPRCLSEEDFYYSKQQNGEWQPREFLSNINTHFNEGGQCISPDGKYMIFTACDRDEGFGSCDLYWSKRIGDNWSKPKNCGKPVNTKYWESQPTFGADGRTIYFISARPGGVGKKDIWRTYMVEDGVFTEPENIGKPINTMEDEVSAYFHPDGKTMYFVSYGHKGMGDADIFYTVLNEDGTWMEPVNMGYPINTYAEEFSLVVNAAGDKAYFSSDKEGGYGNLDLYWFELPKHLRPSPVTYLKGRIFDAEDKSPLAAKFELVDLKTGNIVTCSTSDPVTGEFLVCIPTDKLYALNAVNEKYLFYSENFQIESIHTNVEPYQKDIALKRINIGESVVLKNVFFDTDKSTLKEESQTELDRVVALMKENPRMKVEIGGHTDNVGTEEYNQKLSSERAKAVYTYLIKAGIEASRLTYKGYGETKPIADNDTEEGRAQNRRTEFTITAC
ncbi:MAG: OmpA family protein [Bacteroidales bacterium]|nr:OmpA family protein [Bacteroidales bacterium]